VEVALSVRLFVGNLPPRLCFPELEDLFLPFGTIVSADLMTDPTTGRSRGFGFVEMESNDAARTAITALNGSTIEGQALTVNEANPGRGGGASHDSSARSSAPSSGSVSRPFSPGPRPAGSSGTRLFVGNLPYTATNADLERLFAEAGKVASVSVMTDRATGQSKGFAFVEMGSKEDAVAAIKRFDGREGIGRILKVNEARPPERRPGGFSGGGGGRRY
jgi:RNA recognition motif-containing protein